MAHVEAQSTDDELAQAVRAEDHAAFKTLYYRYYEPLYRFLWRHTRDTQTSQDLVQEVFARIWQQREKLDPQRSLKAYLYRIAYNLAIDHLRKQAHRPSVLELQPAKEPAYLPNESFDLPGALQTAIQNLPEPLRLVFTMNRFDEATYAEIAETLQISVKTVESRMSKALKELRGKLREFL